MKYRTVFDPAARAEIRRLPRQTAITILRKLAELEQDPYGFATTALVGDPSVRRLRVGNYRVFYEVQNDELVVWGRARSPPQRRVRLERWSTAEAVSRGKRDLTALCSTLNSTTAILDRVFEPAYVITPAITKALMEVEASRQAVIELPINVEVLASLRETARLAATHYSTQIEGNRLTRAQVEEALAGAHFPGRERDEAEVRNYYRALEHVEQLAAEPGRITEDDLRRIHGLVMHGRAGASAYRDGQNVIQDSRTGGIVYLPPEASDVPGLMAALVDWVNDQLDSRELPAPIVAAVAHYQYATIHPYYDGNGRTARLLTTLILHRSGYGLKGIYSLEEHYVRDLGGYYAALTVGPSHNYYLGLAEADITGFVDYFSRSMADAFSAVRAQAAKAVARDARDASPLLRQLDPRQRRCLSLYRDRGIATTTEIAAHLGLSRRTVANLCRQWVTEGFLEVSDQSRKGRSYRLGPAYEFLHHPSAVAEKLDDVRVLRLRRRGASDLALMRADQAERDGVVVDFTARLLAALVHYGALETLRRVLPEALPWATFLPEADADQLLRELVAVAQGAAALENLTPVSVLLTQWRHTAEVYADPALLEILTREPEGDLGPVPPPGEAR